uniref:Uncharacterized protein n=1 Tax=Siphoviridae sp. ctDyb2 TaxID=2826201 RepID=A0A8S5MCI4_9CAUD|nr:MAG TPA: hypothetical protein [Siphoviridae sp. ctDyb2]
MEADLASGSCRCVSHCSRSRIVCQILVDSPACRPGSHCLCFPAPLSVERCCLADTH